MSSLNLLNELGKKRSNARLAKHFIFFATSLINSIIQEHECLILFYHRTLKLLKNFILAMNIMKMSCFCHLFRNNIINVIM